MRHDKQLKAEHKLLPRQEFFSNCWFNMVHESSLDSYRVRTMNPPNILRELLIMFEPHANDNDRTRVAQEALQILAEKNVLGSPRIAPVVQDIVSLLAQAVGKKDATKSSNNKSDSTDTPKEKGSFGRTGPLIQALVRELLHYLDDCFVPLSLDWLKETISVETTPLKAAAETTILFDIERVTCNLLSSLLDKGWSLESLFQFHQRMLIPRDNIGQYKFDVAFSKVHARLISPPKPYTVVFAILDISRPKLFPQKIADILFDVKPPNVDESSNDLAKKYASAAGNKLFATVTVKAQDGRAAGMKASDTISHILDLVRFEYERKNISLHEQFLLIKEDNRCTRLTIPKVVPNPESGWQPTELENFVKKLEDLVSGGTLPDDAKDRIYSAFRLYRVGADTRNFENKLVNWWTAVEFLVKGTNGGGAIGDGVEAALIPPLMLSYVPKHLDAFRSHLAHLEIDIKDPTGQAPVNFRKMSGASFYALLVRPDMEPLFEAACNSHGFLWMKLQPFIIALRDPKKMAELMQSHEERLGWNIQRIYRARCDIVHSAQRQVNSALLCANLEFYLKCVLRAFLDSLHTIPTLRDSKEFFERQKHLATRIHKDLKAGNASTLVAILPRSR